MAAKKKNSLVNNINAKKKAGTSRSKSRSTVSKEAYAEMQAGWPHSEKKKPAAKKKSAKKTAKKSAATKKPTAKKSATKKPTAKKSATKRPTAKKSTAKKRTTARKATKKSAA